MSWSPQQDAALKAVAEWLRRGDRPVFRLFGYAGTGKTTLAKHIAEDVDGEVAFGAYTGKAALVLRSKGCPDASTIHSMIYRSRESDEGGPQFVLNRQSPAAKADLIIIDECSMVDEELGRDLLSFGQPVLVLGDPAQLPPGERRGLLHGGRTRRDADGGASAGQGQSDRPSVDEGARGRAPRAGHLWGEPRHPPTRDRCRAWSWGPIRCWSASTRRAGSTIPAFAN